MISADSCFLVHRRRFLVVVWITAVLDIRSRSGWEVDQLRVILSLGRNVLHFVLRVIGCIIALLAVGRLLTFCGLGVIVLRSIVWLRRVYIFVIRLVVVGLAKSRILSGWGIWGLR